MRLSSRWLPYAVTLSLALLLLVLPLVSRLALGWSDPRGYLSDLAIGGGLLLLLRRRPFWLALPVLMVWALLTLGAQAQAPSLRPEVVATDLQHPWGMAFVDGLGDFCHYR